MKKYIMLMAMSIAVLCLSACKIEADWERSVSAQKNNEQRAEWLKDMQVLPSGSILVAAETIVMGANRRVDILLAELDKQGNTVWQQVFDLGEDESIVQLLVSGDNAYLLINNPDGKSRLLAVDSAGQQRWLHSYQDGSARSMQLIADKIYITGKRTQVLDTTGTMRVDIHQSEQTWAVEVGLLGHFYVASAKGLTAYDSQGNQLWFLTNTEPDLSQRVVLAWQAGALYMATTERQGSEAQLTKVNAFLGAVEWQRKIASPSKKINLSAGPVLVAAAETGGVLVVQSYARGRQLTMLDNRGRSQWQAQQVTGVAQDIVLNAQGDLMVTGGGLTERFNMQGKKLAWANLSGVAQSTTGEVELAGDSIYIGASIYRDGKIQAVVAHYTEQ